MTAHAHDPAMPLDEAVDAPTAAMSARGTSARPRWLMPGLAVGVVVAGLVAAGVVSLSTALYAAMFGGMLLMHLGGHGMHGGHGGGGHGGGSSDGPAPSEPQRMSQPAEPGAAPGESGDGGPDEGPGIEAPQHDERGSHGCH